MLHTTYNGFYCWCLKVRWKGYSYNDDTWEPIEALRYCATLYLSRKNCLISWSITLCFAYHFSFDYFSNCEEVMKDFVTEGYRTNILPLPVGAI